MDAIADDPSIAHYIGDLATIYMKYDEAKASKEAREKLAKVMADYM